MKLSDYDNVRDFTIQAGQQCTDEPEAMNKEEVTFLLRMCLSELQELALTVTDNVEESVNLLQECMKTIDKSAHEKLTTSDEIIAAQADAVVDAWYYSCNAFAKKTVDVSKIFNVVHAANMAKRDPKTKKFVHREDGKIIKPDGWKAPDIVAEVAKQRKVIIDRIQHLKYIDVLDKTVPNTHVNEIVKRIAKSTIGVFVEKGVDLPLMDIDIEKGTEKTSVTFAWNDRLKYVIYNSGNTSVLDIPNLKLLENGFNVTSAETCIIKWLQEYKNKTPIFKQASRIISGINLHEMTS